MPERKSIVQQPELSRAGYWLPRVVAVFALLSFASRMIPRDWLVPFGYRPDFRVFRPTDPLAGAFEPNRTTALSKIPGDLTRLGNLKPIEPFRSAVFQADQLGYLNPPAVFGNGRVDTLLVGDSFSTVEGNTGFENLGTQIGDLIGRQVYNAGRPGVEGVGVLATSEIRDMTSRLRMRRGLVLYEHYELVVNPRIEVPTPPTLRHVIMDRLMGAERRSSLRAIYLRAAGVDGLRIMAQAALRTVQNGWLLPNRAEQEVVTRQLNNGEPMEFFTQDLNLEAETLDRARPSWINEFIRLNGDLRGAGLNLLVLLVPAKSTVYGPLLNPRENTDSRVSAMDEMELALRQAGIPTVNLVHTFQREAALRLETNHYIYWRSDTHWNGDGIAIAANAMKRELDRQSDILERSK